MVDHWRRSTSCYCTWGLVRSEACGGCLFRSEDLLLLPRTHAWYKYTTPKISSIKERPPVPMISTMERHPLTHTSLQWVIPSEMSLTRRCLGATDDAEWFLPPQPSYSQQVGSTCCSKTTVATVILGKSVSPVGIDMRISQLLLDVPSKNKQLWKRFLYFRPKLAVHQGSSAGTDSPSLDLPWKTLEIRG